MQGLDRLWNALLQLVLERRGTEQQELLLNARCRLLDLFLPVFRRRTRRVVRPRPHQKLVLRQHPIANTQRPQPPIGKHVHILGRLLLERRIDARRKPLIHDRVRTLAIQDNPTVGRANDHAHPLPRAVELDRLEQRVPLGLTHDLDVDRVLGLAYKRKAHVPRGTHECRLVRRLCLVLQVPWLLGLPGLVCEDGVTNGQRAEKGGDVPGLFGRPVRDVLGELGRDERELVNLCVPVLEELGEGGHHGVFELGELARKLLGLDCVRASFACRSATLRLGDTLPVDHPVDGALLKLHNVLGECAGLVGKDVFDLAKVVRDTPVLGDAGGVKGLVIHVDVLCDKVGLDGLDDFDRDEERYGDDVLECDEARSARLCLDGFRHRGRDSHKGDKCVEH